MYFRLLNVQKKVEKSEVILCNLFLNFYYLDIINCVFAVSALYRTSNLRAMQTHPEQYEKGGDHIKYIDLSKYVNPKQENEMNNF